MFARICSLIAILAMVLTCVGIASAFKHYIDAENTSTPITKPFEVKKDKADAFGDGYILAPQGSGNDGNAIATYEFSVPGGKYRFWGWSKMDSRNCAGTDGADQLVVDLTKGTYTLYIIQREDGTELDGILVTDEDLQADQLPKTNAEARAIVAVEAKDKLATAWGAIKAQR